MRNRRNRRAAGLLPAAVEEIKRLRAEWAALKDTDLLEVSFASIEKKEIGSQSTWTQKTKKTMASTQPPSDVLRGIVALVEVGTEPRALPLRAALSALGATVVPLWSPLVTHVVWSEGGDRQTRAEARASAAHVVSPLWVEACATSNERVPEKSFPAAPRPSDLPSPNTMLSLLKRAEREKQMKSNMTKPSATVTSRDLDSDDSDEPQDSAEDTSRETGAAASSRDAGAGPSRDTRATARKTSTGQSDPSTDEEVQVNSKPRRVLPLSSSFEDKPDKDLQNLFLHDSEDEDDAEVHVNALPRRALPQSFSPAPLPKPDKKMRTLFTQREVEPEPSDSSDLEYEVPIHEMNNKKMSCPGGCSDAELLSRVHRSAPPPYLAYPILQPRFPPSRRPVVRTTIPSQDAIHARDGRPRIVLTGMSRTERRRVYDAAKQLEAKVQKRVTYKTTHVVIGNFGKDDDVGQINMTAMSMPSTSGREGARRPPSPPPPPPPPPPPRQPPQAPASDDSSEEGEEDEGSLRTLNALAGAARGCRVVFAQWVYDSALSRVWLAYRNYAVPHLKTISETAYLERRAYKMMDADYAFNVFHGRRVRLSTTAENRHAAEHLLALCGAVVVDEFGQIIHNEHLERDVMEDFLPDLPPLDPPRNPPRPNPNCTCGNRAARRKDPAALRVRNRSGHHLSEVVLGTYHGQVSSMWVFDSVASARMRSLRRYTYTGAS